MGHRAHHDERASPVGVEDLGQVRVRERRWGGLLDYHLPGQRGQVGDERPAGRRSVEHLPRRPRMGDMDDAGARDPRPGEDLRRAPDRRLHVLEDQVAGPVLLLPVDQQHGAVREPWDRGHRIAYLQQGLGSCRDGHGFTSVTILRHAVWVA